MSHEHHLVGSPILSSGCPTILPPRHGPLGTWCNPVLAPLDSRPILQPQAPFYEGKCSVCSTAFGSPYKDKYDAWFVDGKCIPCRLKEDNDKALELIDKLKKEVELYSAYCADCKCVWKLEKPAYDDFVARGYKCKECAAKKIALLPNTVSKEEKYSILRELTKMGGITSNEVLCKLGYKEFSFSSDTLADETFTNFWIKLAEERDMPKSTESPSPAQLNDDHELNDVDVEKIFTPDNQDVPKAPFEWTYVCPRCHETHKTRFDSVYEAWKASGTCWTCEANEVKKSSADLGWVDEPIPYSSVTVEDGEVKEWSYVCPQCNELRTTPNKANWKAWVQDRQCSHCYLKERTQAKQQQRKDARMFKIFKAVVKMTATIIVWVAASAIYNNLDSIKGQFIQGKEKAAEQYVSFKDNQLPDLTTQAVSLADKVQPWQLALGGVALWYLMAIFAVRYSGGIDGGGSDKFGSTEPINLFFTWLLSPAIYPLTAVVYGCAFFANNILSSAPRRRT